MLGGLGSRESSLIMLSDDHLEEHAEVRERPLRAAATRRRRATLGKSATEKEKAGTPGASSASEGHAPHARPAEPAPLARQPRPAPYAAGRVPSRGRVHAEPDCPTRTPFQRDRDRIVHSSAFRRLTYKTQVFLYHEGDHYRTRLTHSLEVAQIARSLARLLALDEDLAEAIALAHDLGHPPFGHAGERALDKAMAEFGGFDHNAQSLRVVMLLERRYAAFDGLNLTFETLEGLLKHNGPGAWSSSLAELVSGLDFSPTLHGGAEAQVAALADDIAYNNHDLDDALRARLIELEMLEGLALTAPLLEEVRGLRDDLDGARAIYELNRRLITTMIMDAARESERRACSWRLESPEAVRTAPGPLVAFSEPLVAGLDELRRFLYQRVYRHERVMRVMSAAEKATQRLFERYWQEPEALPGEWRRLAAASGDDRARARTIADFIAGMTDRYAIQEYERLFDARPELLV